MERDASTKCNQNHRPLERQQFHFHFGRVHQSARAKPRPPIIFDRKDHPLSKKRHALEKLSFSCPSLPFFAGSVDSAEKRVSNCVCDLRPFPPRAETRPETPTLQTLGTLLGQILPYLSRMFARHSRDMNSTPSCPRCQLPRPIDFEFGCLGCKTLPVVESRQTSGLTDWS